MYQSVSVSPSPHYLYDTLDRENVSHSIFIRQNHIYVICTDWVYLCAQVCKGSELVTMVDLLFTFLQKMRMIQ